MPQALTEKLEAEVADNLTVKLVAHEGAVTCHWDMGYLDDEDKFVRLFSAGHAFTGAEFEALANAQDFDASKTNYENIRDAVYVALIEAGKI